MTTRTPPSNKPTRADDSGSVSRSNDQALPMAVELQPSKPHQVTEIAEPTADEEVKAYFSDLLRRVHCKTVTFDGAGTMSGHAATPRYLGQPAVTVRSSTWKMPPPLRIAPEHQYDCCGMREISILASRLAISTSEKQRFKEEATNSVVLAILTAMLGFAVFHWGSMVHETVAHLALVPCAVSVVYTCRALLMSSHLGRIVSKT
jgi:hypothetical protein